MEKIIKKIAEIRSKKGFSYENMAHDLDLSTSAYRKIETGETKLTVERLVDISKILETPLNELLETDSQKNFNQEIRENATGYQAVDNENIYYEYSEVSKKLIEVYEQQIKDLKAEIEALKSK
ncbi:transcriptional regulator with XRE-family HTH domain [Chryseobacterium sp. SORGH_AS 447]|uniref:helix-turn-helix domain-containing protein n=1 Tax=Chryseobacterium sp. SORGH_AS_0447 TaxID=3041769 RepID=UPI002781C3D6|nr:helix-turn-helix transcriptional regulator [Chryseobacterium sp. SORGH_AS_0447]MDQ1160448.1 transcriptional regulator with XRE-family HTH domain [Chryseobacterium sp. SORGH_AS_0447]